MTDRAEIEWAPHVNLYKVRQFYRREAGGILDDELIEGVGYGLYCRLQTILAFTEAVHERVKCKCCSKTGRTTILRWLIQKPGELIKFPLCACQGRWRVYLTESKKKTRGQLIAGEVHAAFQEYTRV